MATVLDLRRRIRSVKSTQQLTRAMKMVAAARLRRSQERILNARPYARMMRASISSIASRVDTDLHPLLAVPEESGIRKVHLLVITADRGLCGGFNSNIQKKAMDFLGDHQDSELALHLVGRRGVDYFKRRDYSIKDKKSDVFRTLDFPVAQEIGDELIDEFLNGELDAVYMIYNEFKSLIQQNLVVERLLPIERESDPGPGTQADYLFEPDAKTILEDLLPRHIRLQVWRALLESNAAEQAARMTAMEAATKNAEDMVADLTMTMNRIRQAGITREIIEVVSGADAL